MPRGDASLQGGAQRLRRRLDAAPHQGEQLVRVSLAVDQRVQDGAAGNTHDLGQHRAELEVGVLQRLLQPLHVAGLLAHRLLAGARACPQLLRRRPRHKARADQAVRQQVGQPQRVGDTGLAAGHVLDVRGIGGTSVNSPSDSTCQTGLLWMPVASIATWVQPCSASQANNASPGVVVLNVRTSVLVAPSPARRTPATTVSLCTSRPAQRG